MVKYVALIQGGAHMYRHNSSSGVDTPGQRICKEEAF